MLFVYVDDIHEGRHRAGEITWCEINQSWFWMGERFDTLEIAKAAAKSLFPCAYFDTN